MPVSQDLVIFFVDNDKDGQTNHFTPCACTHGNMSHNAGETRALIFHYLSLNARRYEVNSTSSSRIVDGTTWIV